MYMLLISMSMLDMGMTGSFSKKKAPPKKTKQKKTRYFGAKIISAKTTDHILVLRYVYLSTISISKQDLVEQY